jgi:antitoxin (DNA-binding transcriptional repressor) of toxin-antitoxin stability system
VPRREQDRKRELIIARRSRPMARLVPLEKGPAGKRIGVAKGAFEVPDSFNARNKEIAELFLGRGNV